MMKKFKNIDEYISNYPLETQLMLRSIRQTIAKTAPKSKEKISYGIPTFFQNENLVHFAAYENHIGFYPGSEAIIYFAAELKPYEMSKGTVKFPIDKPIPLELIQKITEHRIQKISEK